MNRSSLYIVNNPSNEQPTITPVVIGFFVFCLCFHNIFYYFLFARSNYFSYLCTRLAFGRRSIFRSFLRAIFLLFLIPLQR